jgi:lysylphosphatidylglycerol synthetase-like protein (DUF2156 family)
MSNESVNTKPKKNPWRPVRYFAGALAALTSLHSVLTALAILRGHTGVPLKTPFIISLIPFALTIIMASIAFRLFRPTYHRAVLLSLAAAIVLVVATALEPHPLTVKGTIVICAAVLADLTQTLWRARYAKTPTTRI